MERPAPYAFAEQRMWTAAARTTCAWRSYTRRRRFHCLSWCCVAVPPKAVKAASAAAAVHSPRPASEAMVRASSPPLHTLSPSSACGVRRPHKHAPGAAIRATAAFPAFVVLWSCVRPRQAVRTGCPAKSSPTTTTSRPLQRRERHCIRSGDDSAAGWNRTTVPFHPRCDTKATRLLSVGPASRCRITTSRCRITISRCRIAKRRVASRNAVSHRENEVSRHESRRREPDPRADEGHRRTAVSWR